MLPWLLAWTRLVADEEVAVTVANEAVARAASRPKRLTGTALRAASRNEAARLLARGVAAVPDEGVGDVRADTFAPPSNAAPPSPPAPDRPLTPTERLALALAGLAPHERLACVAYVLDGASTSDIATLLAVPHDRAAAIIERAYRAAAAAVGESDLPDFAAVSGSHVEVVTR